MNESLWRSSETNFRLIQAYNWSKYNFGEIHISPKGETGRLPLSSIILSWTDGIRHFEVARRPGRDGCQVHCGTVLGHAFSTWRKLRQNSPTMHFDNQLDPISRATSKWRILRAHK